MVIAEHPVYRPDITDEQIERYKKSVAEHNASPARQRRLRQARWFMVVGYSIAIAILGWSFMAGYQAGESPWYLWAPGSFGVGLAAVGWMKWESNRERYDWEIFD